MTTRRQFFRSLAIGTAALYLRFAPDAVRSLSPFDNHLAQMARITEQMNEIFLKKVWDTNPYAALLKEEPFV